MIVEGRPLVTVGVLAYNSAATILDTLDSVLAQTYNNIELIISDDGSDDNTVESVKQWIVTHKNEFTIAKVIAVEKNTGIPANCNRLLSEAHGVWIKIIAGDDLLLPNCIYDFLKFIKQKPEAKVVYSNYRSFISASDGSVQVLDEKLDDKINMQFDADAHTQLYTYIEKGFNISPSVFMNVEFAKSFGFIEKYKVFEDTPFYVRILKNGTKIYHLNKDTVLYRSDGDSVTRERNRKHFYKKTFVENYLLFRREMIYPLYPWYKIVFWIKELSFIVQYKLTIHVLHNKRTPINNMIYNMFKALNPYYLIKFFIGKIC